MKWPWRKASNDRLVFSFTGETLVYGRSVDGRLVRCGVEQRGADTPQAFARRARSLGLQSGYVTALLRPQECQLLQIEAPTVPAAELKSAARWRIKDLVDAHLDDLTLDVMLLGDERARNKRQLFVAAARTQAIRDLSEWSHAAGLELGVIDIRETAQRNLQSALAQLQGRAESASAALMLQGDECLLTICANGELFYARRLAWDGLAAGGDHLRPNGGLAQPGAGASPEEFAMLDIVDYGADALTGAGAGSASSGSSGSSGSDEPPRFVIELQRSLDLWERSWPDLPLGSLMIQMNDDTQAVAEVLRQVLALPIEILQPELVFADLAVTAGAPAVRSAVVPLLGALLRSESRQL
jgi:MSHA biogenesis protein MshI